VYWVQLVFAFIVNWGVNFGFEWATLTNYGQKSMQPIKFWTKNSVNASVLSDVIISTMIIAFLHVTLATWGIKVRPRAFVCPCVRFGRLGAASPTACLDCCLIHWYL
jgi:hypothetical protein